jgi:hypothetical protein
MALIDPFVTVVRVTEGVPFGDAMTTIRAWLDGQKIQPAAFTAAADAKGYTLTIGFRTIEEASRFNLQFAANDAWLDDRLARRDYEPLDGGQRLDQ